MSKGNESAFPEAVAVGPSGDIYTSSLYAGCGGLTKREYFAAMAMQVMIEKLNYSGLYREENKGDSVLVARQACLVADALLAALNTETED